MKKRILSLLMALTLCLSLLPTMALAGADNTWANPQYHEALAKCKTESVRTGEVEGAPTYEKLFLAGSAEELATYFYENDGAGQKISENYALVLTKDISLAGHDWVPVEAVKDVYGQNHTISGMNVTQAIVCSEEGYQNFVCAGFFGRVKGNCSICDLNVRGSISFGTDAIDEFDIGQETDHRPSLYVGGIAGMAAEALKITFDNCSSDVDINVTYTRKPENMTYDGADLAQTTACGIVANVWYVSNLRIRNCVNYGNITLNSSGAESGSYLWAGGIAFDGNSGDIYNCANFGEISATAYYGDRASSKVVAHNNVKNCYSRVNGTAEYYNNGVTKTGADCDTAAEMLTLLRDAVDKTTPSEEFRSLLWVNDSSQSSKSSGWPILTDTVPAEEIEGEKGKDWDYKYSELKAAGTEVHYPAGTKIYMDAFPAKMNSLVGSASLPIMTYHRAATLGYFEADGYTPTTEGMADNAVRLKSIIELKGIFPITTDTDWIFHVGGLYDGFYGCKGDHTGYTKWKASDHEGLLPNAAGSYFLTEDVTLTKSWTLPEGTEASPIVIDLCLNGHVIDANGGNFSAITIPAYTTLNLHDCGKEEEVEHYFVYHQNGVWEYLAEPPQEQQGAAIWIPNISDAVEYGTIADGDIVYAKGGVITGSRVNGSGEGRCGGGVYIEAGGTLNMSGCNIIGNAAADGGGVYNKGSFTMRSASYNTDYGTKKKHCYIAGNTACVGDSTSGYNGNGGGIYSSGTLILNGTRVEFGGDSLGEISGNYAASGGVYFGSGSFKVKDTEIMNNRAAYVGGGVLAAHDGMIVGGVMEIEDNYGRALEDTPNSDNLYLAVDRTVEPEVQSTFTFGTDDFAPGDYMTIYVTTETEPTLSTSVPFTSVGTKENMEGYIEEDNESVYPDDDELYTVEYVAADASNGRLQLAKVVGKYPISVGGVQVTEANLNDVFGDAAQHNGVPTVKYTPTEYSVNDPALQTPANNTAGVLTLTGAQIATDGESVSLDFGIIDVDNSSYGSALTGGLTIELAEGSVNQIGETVVYVPEETKASDYNVGYGIYSLGNVTFTGAGKLTIYGNYTGIIANSAISSVVFGTQTQPFTGTVDIESYDSDCGAITAGGVTLNGGTVNLTSRCGLGVYALGTSGVEINGGEVSVASGYAGIISLAGNVAISGDNTAVTVDAQNFGIYTYGSVTIDGSTVNAKCARVGESADILAYGGLVINAKNMEILNVDKSSETYLTGKGNDYVTIQKKQPTPPSSGGSSTPTVTVPVAGDKDSVKISATVSGSTAKIKNVTDEQLEKIGTGDEVTVDLSSLNKSVTGVTFPKTTLENIAESEASGLEVKLPNGTTAVFDKATVAAIAEQAEGEDIQLVIDTTLKAAQVLTGAQKSAIQGMKSALVLEAYFTSNGKRISDFKGGEAELTVSYPTTKPVRVGYLTEAGALEEVPSSFDGKSASFVVKHFSNYVIEQLDGSSYASCPQDATCPIAKFIDVDTKAWYHDGVHYCVENGMMNGVGNDLFAPGETLTRGMVVTMLARLSGVDTSTDGVWYVPGQEWAVANGISDGTNMTAAITREQLATMLFRYAVLKGVDTAKLTENTNTLSYDDVFTISDWAASGMHFCIAAGVVNGDNGMLYPTNTATRAEAATMFQRLGEKVLAK